MGEGLVDGRRLCLEIDHIEVSTNESLPLDLYLPFMHLLMHPGSWKFILVAKIERERP